MVHSKGHTEKDILGGFSSRRKAPLAMSLVGRVDLPAVLGRQVLVGEATYKPESTDSGRQVGELKRQEGAPLNLG